MDDWTRAQRQRNKATGLLPESYDLGPEPDPFDPGPVPDGLPARRVRVTWADTIMPRPVVWAWVDEGEGRIPAGSLSIAAGREGTGKSSYGIWMAAAITRGTLPGSYRGTPRRVLYAALEDSWEHTIVPRLMAAGADLSLVGRLDVVNLIDEEIALSLPCDNRLLEQVVRECDAALVMIDPIMSVLAEKISASRSKEVRTALDPLVKIAQRTGSVILGICHFNKATGNDPTLAVTESKAFTDVPRSVFVFARDEETDCGVMSQMKNSLGRDWTALPSLKYTIRAVTIDTDDGATEVGKFTWEGTSDRSVGEVLRDRGRDPGEREERSEASAWLTDYLNAGGGQAPAKDVLKAARAAGLSDDAVKYARIRIKAASVRSGFGKGAFYTWTLAHGCVMECMDVGFQNPTSMTPMDTPKKGLNPSPWGENGAGR